MEQTMDMDSFGFDDFFSRHAEALLEPGQIPARVMTVDRGAYLVRGEAYEGLAELSGKFRFATDSSQDLPCVGDWVCIEKASAELAIIHQVLPRKTFLQRKRAGKAIESQMIASNLDAAFIVQSCHYDFNVRRLERYLVVVNEGGVEPIIVLTKTDLVTGDVLEGLIQEIEAAGIWDRVLPISNTTGDGFDKLKAVLHPGKTYCLLGSSGVGKTTIINRLLGQEALETSETSETGEGVHTTSRRHLLALDDGAMIIDTPGMREIGIMNATEGLEDGFSDIRDLSLTCRFSDCTHTQEPGCAVLAAVDTEELSRERYESYLKLRKESVFHDLSYKEKRQKDKDFGKFIKNVKKDIDRQPKRR